MAVLRARHTLNISLQLSQHRKCRNTLDTTRRSPSPRLSRARTTRSNNMTSNSRARRNRSTNPTQHMRRCTVYRISMLQTMLHRKTKPTTVTVEYPCPERTSAGILKRRGDVHTPNRRRGTFASEGAPNRLRTSRHELGGDCAFDACAVAWTVEHSMNSAQSGCSDIAARPDLQRRQHQCSAQGSAFACAHDSVVRADLHLAKPDL